MTRNLPKHGSQEIDATIVGAGPNGLAAAVTMARAGLKVRVIEKADIAGGGASTTELTLPGFLHDVCSAVHPLAFESEFFKAFELDRRIEFVVPEVSYAHPLDSGRTAVAYRDLLRTQQELGRDGARYGALLQPLVDRATKVAELTGDTLLRIPADFYTALRFGLAALEQGSVLWNQRFQEDLAPALLTGVSAHTILPLPSLAGAGAGLALSAYGHARGWPIPVGGSQAIIDALVSDLQAHGGELITGHVVSTLDELEPSRIVLLDVTPQSFLQLAGHRLPAGYRRRLAKFRYGSAVAKVDFALSAPVPWSDPVLHETPTLHLGGTRSQIKDSEGIVARGRLPKNPYVLVSQPSLFDHTRAPEGKHTLWAYTHVPAHSSVDRQEAVISQIERFAPHFRDTILATSSRTAVEIASYNPNYPGGDIAAGVPSLAQMIARPVLSPDPWRTPIPGIYLCSASTSPGPGVHGLAGWRAALSALRHEHGITAAPNLRII